jgi:hypothetical protein
MTLRLNLKASILFLSLAALALCHGCNLQPAFGQ